MLDFEIDSRMYSALDSAQCPFSFFQHTPANDDRVAFGFFQLSYSMMQSDRYKGLKSNWVLLDSQSNCDIFCNHKMLKNIRVHDSGAELKLVSNGGELITSQVGDVSTLVSAIYI